MTSQSAIPSGTVQTLTLHALVGYSFSLWQSDNALLEAGPRVGAGRTASRWSGGIVGEVGYAGGPIGYADDREIARTAGFFGSAQLELTLSL